ncbi:MAG: hypothetical protein E7615_01870 [Ruminococcaceae bacterium]|nr:hypothetical protein [Oscillospiraceae bacterium]
MKEYNGLHTEEVSAAHPYRHNYLDSVNNLAILTSEVKQGERDAYITPEKLRLNREKYVADFKNIIGEPLFDRKKQNEVQKMFVGIDAQGYIYRLVFNYEKGIKFCGLLFVPFDAKKKLPLVTAIHGGDGTPELMSDMYGKNYYGHITRRLLDRNVIVFAPQLLIWDGRSYGDVFDRFEIDSRYKALGGSLTAFEVECIRGALDKLAENELVDSDKMGILGLSYGGYYSLVTAALDDRIKAVYSSCVFNDRIKYSRPDFVYKGMADKFLDAEMAALISPRPLYLEAGKNDGIFKPAGALTEIERLKQYYSDASENLVFKITDSGHKYDESDDGIDFLIKRL